MTEGFLGGYSSGPGFVVGRSEGEGDFKDVRIRTSPDGLNIVELARDARDTSPRRYVVDRRVRPDGAWSRVVEVDSFSIGVPVERMTESRATVEFVGEPNFWGIEPEPCFGLPSGMESPWTQPLEMLSNELLIPLEDPPQANEYTVFVSGDAPVNTALTEDDGIISLKNGAYVVRVGESGNIEVSKSGTPVSLFVKTDGLGRGRGSVEGTAAQAYYEGGNVFLEPAKPPIFYGTYILPFDVRYVSDGLYEVSPENPGYDGTYVITSNPIEGRRASGLVSILFDPYPRRWVRRLMGRAYTSLVAPAYVPPLVEEEPRRISVHAVEVENDYPDIPREVYTPYANRTGVFNAWDSRRDPVLYRPSVRPFDVLIPFDADTNHRDLGGHPVMRGEPDGLLATRDESGELSAARPSEGGIEVGYNSFQGFSELDLREGVLFFKWRDSSEFSVLRHEDMEIYYRDGYLYVDSRSESPGVPSGLAHIGIPGRGEWVAAKVEWGRGELLVNEVPALTETNSWADTLFVGETDQTRTWAEVLGVSVDEGVRNPDLPLAVEDFADVPPEWMTGRPVGEGEEIGSAEVERPRTWGRVLFEEFDGPSASSYMAGGEDYTVHDLQDVDAWRMKGIGD